MTSDIDERFDDEYFRKRDYIAWRGPIIAHIIKDIFNPTSCVDVGCCTGDIAAALNDCGVPTHGIEGSTLGQQYRHLAPDRYITVDLRDFVRLDQVWDLAMCIEVFSIIESKWHPQVMDNLVHLADRLLVNHVDEVAGFRHVWEKTCEFRDALEPWKQKQAFKALYRTARYYERI